MLILWSVRVFIQCQGLKTDEIWLHFLSLWLLEQEIPLLFPLLFPIHLLLKLQSLTFSLEAPSWHYGLEGCFLSLVWEVALFDKEGRPWGSKCLSCVCKLPQLSSQWMQLKLPQKYNRKKSDFFFFLRIALYYILLWADNLFKGWQIVLSVWGNSLQPRFSCSCHGFPLLSIWSVSNHKMSHQTKLRGSVLNLNGQGEKSWAVACTWFTGSLKALVCKAF